MGIGRYAVFNHLYYVRQLWQHLIRWHPLKVPVQRSGFTGSGTPNPLVDTDWTRLAQVKELTPGELTADSFDETYIDDPNADWTATAQGQKSAGDTSLPWPGNPANRGKFRWCSGLKTA
jgi:hypothetical protein